MVSKNTASLTIIPLFIIALLNEISYQMVIPVMNHVVSLTLPHASNALIDTMYGAGIAVFTIAVIVGSPIIGYLSDKFGRRVVLISCVLIMILASGLFLIGLAQKNISYFLIARFLSGIAGASTAIVQAAIADQSFERERSVNFSTVGLALTIGLIIGPLLGGYFLKGTFIITALISFINIFLFLLLYKEVSHTKDYEKLVVHVPHGSTMRFLSLFFLLEFSWSLYYLSTPTYLGNIFSYDSQHVSLFLSSMGILMCFGLLAYRFISKYLNNKMIAKLFFGVFMLSLIIVLLTRNLLLNWILILPITWAVAISYVAIMGLLSESVKQEHQGALMGTTLTTMALAWTMTGFAAKFLFSVSYLLPFSVSFMGLVIGMLLL